MSKDKRIVYYVAYDITEDETRGKVALTLKKYGMDRIQKSLFCGRLNSQSVKDLAEELIGTIKGKKSVYLIPTTKSLADKIIIIGIGFDKDYIYDKKQGEVI